MRHLIASLMLAACLVMAESAAAQTKVGYVDLGKVTDNAKSVNDVMSDLQGNVEDLQKEIDAKYAKYQKLKTEVQSGEGVISEDELKTKRSEILRLQNELDDLNTRGRRRMREIDATVFEPLMKKILFAIEEVAKEKKLDVVLEGRSVLYGVAGADITDDVIKRLEGSGGSTARRTPQAAATKSPAARDSEPPDSKPAESSPSPEPESTPTRTTESTPRPSEVLKTSDPEPTATPEPAATPKATATPASTQSPGGIRIRTPRAAAPEATPESDGTRGTRPVDLQPER